MIALDSRYLGFTLEHPLVPSAGPFTRTVGAIRALEDAGAPAVVLASLFEEDVTGHSGRRPVSPDWSAGNGAAVAPDGDGAASGPDEYLEHLGRVRRAVDIPVIASVNAAASGRWVEQVRRFEQAGASALELNVYRVAADPGVDATQVERSALDLVRAVRAATSLPLAVKLGPWYSAFAAFAAEVVRAGADGLVLFNRPYPPDVDLTALEAVPSVTLSTSADLLPALRWIALLSGRLDASLAATGGVHDALDVLKAVAVGADVAMTCAALLRHGPEHLRTVVAGVRRFLAEQEYESLEALRGTLARHRCPDPAAFERSSYRAALRNFR